MKWVVYGAYRRDTPAIPHTIEASNARHARSIFAKRNPQMHVVRIEKAGAKQEAQREDWYARTKKPRYRRDE